MIQYNGWADMPTIQSKEILTELVDGKENRRALLLVSNTGLGKSHAVNLFIKKYPKQTYLITVGDSWKPRDMVNAIMEAIGITQATLQKDRNMNNHLRMIAAELKKIYNSGTSPILIIDEAENLKPAFLKAIKEIYDAIIKYCSLVLIGTDYILESMLNTRQKNRMSVPQTYRRFKAGIRMISKLDKARDFSPFFEKYIKNYPDVQDMLLKYADNYGELHDYLDPLLRHCNKKNIEPSKKLFQFMHRVK